GAGLEWLATLSDHIRLHRKVLREPQPIHDTRGVLVPFLDTLPELAVVDPREGGLVLLALMAEDRHDLTPELLSGEGDEDIGFGDRPLLPGAAIVPGLRRLAAVLLECQLDRLLAHPVRAMGVGEVAGDEDQIRAVLLEEGECQLDVAGP